MIDWDKELHNFEFEPSIFKRRKMSTRHVVQTTLKSMQRAIEAKKSERDKPDPDVQWAYSYAGKPREFIGQLIPDWEGDDWTAWRAFTSAVFVEPFGHEEEEQIFKRCTGLDSPPTKRPPAVWMPIGRRGGKSRWLSAIAVYLACCFDWSHFLDPGEVGVIPVLSADRRQARIIMSYVKAFLELPRLKNRVDHDNAESIYLKGNIWIEVVTASYRAVRGRTILAALCDEIAFWRSDEDSANPDREIIAALEPAMATIPNALLLGASSPYARRGVLWENFDKWYGKAGGPLIWRADTKTMNPTVPQEFIDEKYEEDPTAAAAEYGAEFRTDVDQFVIREVLDLAIVDDRHELEFEPGLSYKSFVDPSGGSSDSMTLAIAHKDPLSGKGVLDVLRERRPPFSPEAVVAEFAAVLKEYRIFRIKGDHYAGEWPREQFRKRGITYDVSERRKSDIYLEFLPHLNANKTELLDDRRMYNQFLGLERRVSRGGHESIDHGPGGHDDVSNVAAGALVEVLGKKDITNIHPSVLQKVAGIVRPQHPRLGTLGVGANSPRWD